MKSGESAFRRIAVKVGSNVITKKDGDLDTWRISKIVEDLFVINKKGIEVILISSGAVAAGRSEVVPLKKTNPVAAKQMWAAIGQAKLISRYQYLFGKYRTPAGQVLATKESFRDRIHYLNMKNCISAMLENNVLPIVNENDTVSVDELMFTDNDELSGLIASIMDCDSLFILTNVDGVFKGNPGAPGAELIRKIDNSENDHSKHIKPSKSAFGRGGMLTKYKTAMKVASEGIAVYIANGTREGIVSSIISGADVPYTHFPKSGQSVSAVRKWISNSEPFAAGAVTVNRGAREALLGEKATSLLMVGITSVEGSFRKGDIISILDEERVPIGLGKSEFDSVRAAQSIGLKGKRHLIHYHNLILNDRQPN